MLKNSVSTQTPSIFQRPGLHTSFDSDTDPVLTASSHILRKLREAELEILASLGAYGPHRTANDIMYGHQKIDDGSRCRHLRELLPTSLSGGHNKHIRLGETTYKVTANGEDRAATILHVRHSMQEAEKHIAGILGDLAIVRREAKSQQIESPPEPPLKITEQCVADNHYSLVGRRVTTATPSANVLTPKYTAPRSDPSPTVKSQRAQAYLANLERILATVPSQSQL